MKLFNLLIGFVLISTGCAKMEENLIGVPVNFSAPLTDPRLNRLNSIGGAVTIDGYGLAGLIIYRGTNGYVAFDRCSTVNPNQRCAIELDSPTITATDPCSGAKFLLSDGSPVKAPAVIGLKRYSVTIAGNNLIVTN